MRINKNERKCFVLGIIGIFLLATTSIPAIVIGYKIKVKTRIVKLGITLGYIGLINWIMFIIIIFLLSSSRG